MKNATSFNEAGPDSQAQPDSVALVVGEDEGGRLDAWLAGALGPELSRSRIKALIEAGAVAVNGAAARQAKQKIQAGDEIRLVVPEPEDAEPAGEDIPLDILFEDDSLVVLNKQAGLVVHPGAGNWTGTLVNALIHHCGDSLSGIGGVRRPGIVHRLDRDTTGVMVVAKTDQAHRHLADQFADHGLTGPLERAYLAIVWGKPQGLKGTIDAKLGRGRDRTRRAVRDDDGPDVRHAVTHYLVRERYAEKPDGSAAASLVECRLETGRTHQIRVHMAHIGHPLVGDNEYGAAFRTKVNRLPEPARDTVAGFPRQALHAFLLVFEHPLSGETLRFEAPLPADMQHLREAFAAL